MPAQAPAQPKQRGRRKPARRPVKGKPLPRYDVVLLDDPRHTYAYVVVMLGKLFGHPAGRAFLMARTVDTRGTAVVASAHRELAELKRDQIRAFGDAAMPGCHGSMNAVIRPAG